MFNGVTGIRPFLLFKLFFVRLLNIRIPITYCSRQRLQRSAMTNAGCPSVHVTTSDVTAAFLSQPPASGKALIDRQASLRHYARSDDVIDVSPGTGNDYFHQHRRHQFRQLSASAAPRGQVTGTCRSDVIDHVYESPNLDKPAALCSLQNEHIT